MILVGKSDLNGQEKIGIFEIGVRGIRGRVSTCTTPNITSVAAQRQKFFNIFDFFALEVLLFGELFIYLHPTDYI